MNLLDPFAHCFLDGRDGRRVRHSVKELIAQRVYGLALGYEDLNDHERPRQDLILKLLAGNEAMEELLAGKSTLNRLELSAGVTDRYKKITFWKDRIDELLVNVFVEATRKLRNRLCSTSLSPTWLCTVPRNAASFTATTTNVAFSPLYVFCGEHLLHVRLRRANIDASAGSLTEVRRIISQVREHWPQVRITLRADSGFCRDELMSWCEDNHVDFVFGFARNERLRSVITEPLG